MFSFVPHKNNPHSWRTALFVFLMFSVSACGAYLAGARLQGEKTKLIATASKQAENAQVLKNEIPKPPLLQQEEIIPDAADNISKAEPAEKPVEPLPKLPEDPHVRVEQIKAVAKPQMASGKYIDISLKYQNMVLFEDGVPLDAYLISSGKRGLETPVGTYHIENKSPRAWSKEFSLWMPNWMALVPSGKFGIHELPEWPGGYKEGVNHIGTPVSHGCVRLGVGPAKRVYDWADIGTPVIIHK